MDKYHAPIGDALVLVHTRNADDMRVRTNRAGIYEIQLPPGIYDVFVSAEGFSPSCRKLEVITHRTTKFDVTMDVNTLGMEVD